MELISQERLKEVLHYDPDTGRFKWTTGFRKGRSAGNTSIYTGYRRITIDQKHYYAHRLAWFYMTGAWPKHMIDHVDHDRANNRWGNLREADPNQNIHNSRRSSKNTSGAKGVHFHRQTGKWRARIAAYGKTIHVGLYDTVEEASRARDMKAIELHGEYRCG